MRMYSTFTAVRDAGPTRRLSCCPIFQGSSGLMRSRSAGGPACARAAGVGSRWIPEMFNLSCALAAAGTASSAGSDCSPPSGPRQAPRQGQQRRERANRATLMMRGRGTTADPWPGFTDQTVARRPGIRTADSPCPRRAPNRGHGRPLTVQVHAQNVPVDAVRAISQADDAHGRGGCRNRAGRSQRQAGWSPLWSHTPWFSTVRRGTTASRIRRSRLNLNRGGRRAADLESA